MLAVSTPASALTKHAAMVIDGNSGETLHAHAADEPRHPASLTKMMTLYLLFERIEQGQLTYQSKIKISPKAAAVAPSKLNLEPGETIRVIDAIRALIVKSANDIAVAVAEELGGTEAKFAEMMTARARQIGMTSTTYKNASGLPNAAQLSTARDQLTLALRLYDDFPKHYPLFAAKTFDYNGTTHKSHNRLLFNYTGADGIKTGYTRASGFNLVSSVRRNGKFIVAVVMGGHTAAIRNANMRLLLNRAIESGATEATRKPVLVARAAPAVPPAQTRKKNDAAEAKAQQKMIAQAKAEASKRAQQTAAATAATKKPAARPAPPDPSPALPEPSPVATAAAPEASPAPPQALLAAATPEAVPNSTGGTIAVAKVRRVLVTPRVVTAATASATTEEPDATALLATASANATPPRVAPPVPQALFATASAATTTRTDALSPPPSAPGQDLIAAHLTARPSQPAEPLMSAVAGDRPAETAALMPVSPNTTPTDPLAGLARPPSTFEQQMAAMAANLPPNALVQPPIAATTPPATVAALPPPREPTSREPASETQPLRPAVYATTNRPDDPAPLHQVALPGGRTTPPVAGTFQIQVGAYASAADAERQLELTRERAGPVLSDRPPVTVQVQKGTRQIFRARFAGFDSVTAAAACDELRRRQIDCFVMKAE